MKEKIDLKFYIYVFMIAIMPAIAIIVQNKEDIIRLKLSQNFLKENILEIKETVNQIKKRQEEEYKKNL